MTFSISTIAPRLPAVIAVVIGRICFHYYFHKINYVKALACFSATHTHVSELMPKVLWAYYQLGLYRSVCQLSYESVHWRSQYANTVCLAACGEFEKAGVALNAFKLNKHYKVKQKSLAEALAPFSASLALEALDGSSVHPLLYVALHYKRGNFVEVPHIIQSLNIKNHDGSTPELPLINNYTQDLSPAQKIQNINAFLACFNLAPIFLKHAKLPPAVTNISASLPINKNELDTELPLVSVLMTAYNAADYIASAIASVLAQTYKNIELVIVDDASEDATFEVIKNLALKDSRIKYFKLPCNAGTYVAKTVGLQQAKGEFITCHDSDDWSHPSRIEIQMHPLINNQDLVATISDWVRVDEHGIPYARGAFPLMRLNPASPLFRKSIVLRETGTWDLVRTGADSEFIARLRLVFGRKRVKRIRQPLAFGAHRMGSLMTAVETGYSQDNKNNNRLGYWEAWGHWHINSVESGKLPKISINDAHVRQFITPELLQVPQSVIKLCLGSIPEN